MSGQLEFSAYPPAWMKSLVKVTSLTAVALGLSGCDWLGSAAKSGMALLTPKSESDSFTFKGTLPPGFSMEVKLNYEWVDAAQCQAYYANGGKPAGRRPYVPYKADSATNNGEFNFKIPLTEGSGACQTQLGNSTIVYDSQYGEKDWQSARAYGGFRFFEELPANSVDLNNERKLNITGSCSYTFQISKTKLQLSKMMRCRGAGVFLKRSYLPNKEIKLALVIDPEEKPARSRRWTKVANGWKPCFGLSPQDNYNYCSDSPGVFKKFKMEGRECSVYPGCIEPEGKENHDI